uniref:Uncharacterized protein n=1 Tax=Panagrolaimus sp. JU765 TaxID=591449 RepID=A0AC34Q8C5_9BILA
MSSAQVLSSRINELKGAISGLNFSIIFLLVMTTAYVVIRGLDLFLFLNRWRKEKVEATADNSSKKSKKKKKKTKKPLKTGEKKKKKQKTKSSKSSKSQSTLASSTKTKSTKDATSKSTTKSGISTKTVTTTTKSTKTKNKDEKGKKKKTLFDFGKKHENEKASQDVDGIEKRKKPRHRNVKKKSRQPKSDPFEESRKQLEEKNTVDQIPT